MPILNYTTEVNFTKTLGEITDILIAHGAQKIIVDYDGTIPVAVTFGLKHMNVMLHFSLPCNYFGVMASMGRNPKVPARLKTKEQAVRVSWRIIKNWIESQMAIVEAELATVTQVFLPYAITKDGKTLYDSINSGKTIYSYSNERTCNILRRL